MSEGLVAHTAACPHCWQTITLFIDTSVSRQRYVEDCEVCCNPLDVQVRARYGRVIEVTVEPAQ